MRFGRAALLLLAACSSVHDDFERFCHAHENAGVLESDQPGDRAVKISRYLSTALKTKEAKDVLEGLPKLERSQKRQALTDAAAKYGVKPCPLADATWPDGG